MADQFWVRVVGFLQPPPGREVLSELGYYRGDPMATGRMPVGAVSLPSVAGARPAPAARGATAVKPAAEITAGDRLIYFALGPFVLYAVGTVTSEPQPHSDAPGRKVVDVKTDVFINAVMKTPHLGGVILPSGRDLRLLVQQYNYIWLTPEDGQYLVERVSTKAGAKD
jgi:hypothetical protein